MQLHETEPAIVEHGTESALADQNHYRTEVEPVVLQHLLQECYCWWSRDASLSCLGREAASAPFR